MYLSLRLVDGEWAIERDSFGVLVNHAPQPSVYAGVFGAAFDIDAAGFLSGIIDGEGRTYGLSLASFKSTAGFSNGDYLVIAHESLINGVSSGQRLAPVSIEVPIFGIWTPKILDLDAFLKYL